MVDNPVKKRQTCIIDTCGFLAFLERYTQSTWRDKSLLLRNEHNSCYCHRIPILRAILFGCSLVVQVQCSYQIQWAQMQPSISYTSIALLKLTFAMWDNTRSCYVGSLHQISALENAKLKFTKSFLCRFRQILLLHSITQLSRIFGVQEI